MSAEEIIQALVEEQGWNASTTQNLLTQFLDKLGEEDPKIIEKLNIFLVEQQTNENNLYTAGPPNVSDEMFQFLQTIVEEGSNATIADAQELMAQTSPEMLGQMIETLLLEDNGVESLDELDLDSVYDDVAKELDSYEDEYGSSKPLSYFIEVREEK